MSWSDYNFPNCFFSDVPTVLRGLILAYNERVNIGSNYGFTYYARKINEQDFFFEDITNTYFFGTQSPSRRGSLDENIEDLCVNFYNSRTGDRWSFNDLCLMVESLTGENLITYNHNQFSGNINWKWAYQRYLMLNILKTIYCSTKSEYDFFRISGYRTSGSDSSSSSWPTRSSLVNSLGNAYTANTLSGIAMENSVTLIETLPPTFSQAEYESFLTIGIESITANPNKLSILFAGGTKPILRIQVSFHAGSFFPINSALHFKNHRDGLFGDIIPLTTDEEQIVYLNPDNDGKFFSVNYNNILVEPTTESKSLEGGDVNFWDRGWTPSEFTCIKDIHTLFSFYDDVES